VEDLAGVVKEFSIADFRLQIEKQRSGIQSEIYNLRF